MAYQVVARRWRPLSFESVIGQGHVTATLANAIERDRIAHAFLFTGIRGVGKTTVARLLARALNCSDRKGAEPCNQCTSCTQILSGASVDVLEIDGASNRGIEEVRALIDAAAYSPAISPYRIYIIDEVHQLTREAFNALLKILEEPPAHVKFVLATTEAHKLPQTVLSRCQRYDFRRLATADIEAQLTVIVERDGLEVSAEALALLSREADGSMRDAQSLLEQVAAATGGKADVGAVTDLLGIAGAELVVDCGQAVLGGDAARVVEIINEIRNSGHDAERFLFEILELLRHVAVAAAAGPEAVGAGVSDVVRQAVASMKDLRTQLDLQRIFASLLATADSLRRGSMPELVLEMGLLKAASLEPVLSSAEILARLGAMPGGSGGAAAGGAKRSQRPGKTAAARQQAPARDSSPRPREQAARTEQASRHAEQQTTPPTENEVSGSVPDGDRDGSEWEAILQEIRERLGFDLYVTLSNCEVTSFGPELLELRPALGSFRRKLEAPNAIERVREIAAERLGSKLVVRLAGDAKAVPAESAETMSVKSLEDDKTSKLEQEAMEDPLVRGAIDVLGGKVEKISRIDE